MFAGDEIDKNKNENLRRFTRQISFIYEISGGMERSENFYHRANTIQFEC